MKNPIPLAGLIQIAIVVEDIESAVDAWCTLFDAPRPEVRVSDATPNPDETYRGEVAAYGLKVAVIDCSERGSSTPGHAQLFRMAPDGSGLEQLTSDERVNWFPHVAPDGQRLAWISFPPGTLGHPADQDVIIHLREADGTDRDLVHLFGGQGTINVASWAPDSRRLAYVAYPLDQD